MRIYTVDTTLCAGLALSEEDRRDIVEQLELLGVDHIAGLPDRPPPAPIAGMLCLTGDALPGQVAAACRETRARYDGVLGIEASNASDLAVANTLAAVEAGAAVVVGSINGYGGMANLCSVIAALEMKLGHTAVRDIAALAPIARRIAEIVNIALPPEQPYVGRRAFPVPATRWERSFLPPPNLAWHVCPIALGHPLPPVTRHDILDRLQQLEAEGYDLLAADGTLELAEREAAGVPTFTVLGHEVEMTGSETGFGTRATVRVGDGEASGTGAGPVDALYRCLRRLLPAVQLTPVDYRALSLDAARVRVLARWRGADGEFTTMGVAADVVEASWRAMLDAFRLEMLRSTDEAELATARGMSGYGWGV